MDQKLRAVWIDNAPELVKEIDTWRSHHGIVLELIVPYTSYQNGTSEWVIQTHKEGTRALLKDAVLPLEFCDEAAIAHNYIKN